jgi:uncharacterized protein (TIGR00290 family)
VVTVARADADIALMVSKKRKVTISWSGGKDSAFALYKILEAGEWEVKELHTVFNMENGRVGLHGVHENLIGRQADALGLPLVKLYLPATNDHDAYKTLMRNFYSQRKAEGIGEIVFGDIFLEDLKSFRDHLLQDAGVLGIYPLWKKDSRMLMSEFLESGFKTLVCAADKKYFLESDLGKTIDETFLACLHPDVDRCGENGEFHSFVYEGPIFKKRLSFTLGDATNQSYRYQVTTPNGEVIEKESEFLFQDIL